MVSRIAALSAGVACLLVAAAPAAAKNPWLTRHPLNIAHQGGEDEFPSNTIYAFRRALKAGADMLELDVGVTSDQQVVVMHDTTLDRTTSGTGTIVSHTLRQVRALDGAYWFSRSAPHYDHGHALAQYAFRGIATGKRKPPKGYTRADFQVPTLAAVLKAFPHTPINIEVKGQTKAETDDEYIANAHVLARLLKHVHRDDLVVTSFHQKAVEAFHALDPQISLAPGVDGAASFLLTNKSPGAGVQTFDLPVTYLLSGTEVPVASQANIQRAHQAGYAWHSWFSDQDVDGPATWKQLLGWCADGIMTSQPVALERLLAHYRYPARCAAAR